MTHAASSPGLSARERTCPACGTTSTTLFERCPSCGAWYDGPAPGAGRGRRRLLVLAAVLLLAGTVTGVALALRSKSENQRRDAAAAKLLAARERARLIRLQAPHRGGAPQLRPPAGASPVELLTARRALVVAAQDAITADARRRVRTGELDGPIVTTECGPILRAPDAVPDDRRLERSVGRYDCVASRRDVIGSDGRKVAAFGYAYVTALDFRRFTWTFCRNTPPQGERGVALAQVRLDRACLAAKGRALGTGYVDVEPR